MKAVKRKIGTARQSEKSIITTYSQPIYSDFQKRVPKVHFTNLIVFPQKRSRRDKKKCEKFQAFLSGAYVQDVLDPAIWHQKLHIRTA